MSISVHIFSVYHPLSVTIEIVNDMDANEVTFRFSSDTAEAECTYSDSFDAGRFIYGILPDTEDDDADDFHIYAIGINQTGSGPVTHQPTPAPFPATSITYDSTCSAITTHFEQTDFNGYWRRYSECNGYNSYKHEDYDHYIYCDRYSCTNTWMTETHCQDWGGGYKTETDHNDWKYQGLPATGSIIWFVCQTTTEPTTEPSESTTQDTGMWSHSFHFSSEVDRKTLLTLLFFFLHDHGSPFSSIYC